MVNEREATKFGSTNQSSTGGSWMDQAFPEAAQACLAVVILVFNTTRMHQPCYRPPVVLGGMDSPDKEADGGSV